MGGNIEQRQRAQGQGADRADTRQLTLVYIARCRKNCDAADIRACTFTINFVQYFALIHIGSTHSYVSCLMADKLGIEVEETVSNVIVISPLGQFVYVHKIYKRCPLEIQGEVFLTDLIGLPFGEFDLILGMDWLVEHQVSLGCATKWVTLKTAIQKKIIMVGKRRDYLSNMISTLVAKKLVCKRCKPYLAYIHDTSVSESSVEEISTVNDYLDVFPEEFLRLPLEHEVEFNIDLLLGIAPVSINSYCMALKKLVKLKAQLQ
ncbi:uncharacterized protein [Gossypium hirsutum]|uniref:RVP_2 domain-containing protein n=1 Tax=Gossypium hirsutum TaxID=3635 RepID=A0A1U8KNF6_GOSHI|nr:uncharacterized protein LOC107917406 [Gossypium hirsutum]